jgi:hypothetical protein
MPGLSSMLILFLRVWLTRLVMREEKRILFVLVDLKQMLRVVTSQFWARFKPFREIKNIYQSLQAYRPQTPTRYDGPCSFLLE